MATRLAVAAILVLPLSAPALGVELVESAFQVTFHYAGKDFVFDQTTVPLLPANACYNWYARITEPAGTLAGTERLTLPEPLADWGDAATNADDGIEIVEDGKVAVTTFTPELDADGWFSRGWCVAEGDPVGPHTIEVSVDGATLATYSFDVMTPENYSWPSIGQPEPRGRSVDNSW